MSDDWFERALEDDEAAKAEAEAEREGKHEDERERAHSESDDDEREAKAHSPVDAESDDADSSEGSLFETSFGEALQNVPAPEMGTEGDSSGSHSDGSADPFTTETPLAADQPTSGGFDLVSGEGGIGESLTDIGDDSNDDTDGDDSKGETQ